MERDRDKEKDWLGDIWRRISMENGGKRDI